MQEIDMAIQWRTPVSKDFPAGSCIENTAEYSELEIATLGTPEQQYGSTVIASKEPDWQQVLALSTTLSSRTRDLRVTLWLTRALTKIHGLNGLRQGLSAVEAMLESYWEHVHPQLTIDGIEDPHVRYSVLCEYGAPDGLVADLREAPAFATSLGVFTTKDLERVCELGFVELNGATIRRAQIDQMMGDFAKTEQAQALRLPGEILDCIDRISSHVMKSIGIDYTPDLAILQRPLRRVQSLFDGTGASFTDNVAPPEAISNMVAHSGTSSSNSFDMLRSRADVMKALDAVCVYLQDKEPTNPAPLLIRRAQKVMTMNFVDIVKNMTPDGLSQALFLTGTNEEDN